jgi:hypothetical protein
VVEKIYGAGLSLSRVGARIYDVQKKYGVKIKVMARRGKPEVMLVRNQPAEFRDAAGVQPVEAKANDQLL